MRRGLWTRLQTLEDDKTQTQQTESVDFIILENDPDYGLLAAKIQ